MADSGEQLSELSKKSPRDFFKWVRNLRNMENDPSTCINDKNGTPCPILWKFKVGGKNTLRNC